MQTRRCTHPPCLATATGEGGIWLGLTEELGLSLLRPAGEEKELEGGMGR